MGLYLYNLIFGNIGLVGTETLAYTVNATDMQSIKYYNVSTYNISLQSFPRWLNKKLRGDRTRNVQAKNNNLGVTILEKMLCF